MSLNGKYHAAGVDYDVLDNAKRAALGAAAATVEAKKQDHTGAFHSPTGSHDVEYELKSQGESAFVFKANGLTLATVLECLGTKSVIAREYAEVGGASLFRNVGVDGVAAAVNDLICVGALPLVVHAYFATGETSWYDDKTRFADLVQGWREGCEMAGAAWGGGESPTLSGLIAGKDIEIAGSAVGFIPKSRIDASGEAVAVPVLGERLTPGDEIVLVSSSGLHSNGATLVRKVVATLSDGYRTHLPSGKEFGAAVLDSALIYTGLVADLHGEVDVTYYSHITGHGLRKLMRAHRELKYVIRELPRVPEVLSFLQQAAGMSDYDAYGTLNMGAGFAVFCPRGDGERVVKIARGRDLEALVAGEVVEGPRGVVLEPVGVTFEEDDLRLRRNS